MSEAAAGELAVGQAVEIAIERAVYRGRGLGRVAGRVVFVPRAYPGDRVLARVRAVHAAWAEASLVELLEPSPWRRAPPCPNGPACGGCTYQDVVHEEQLRLKESVLRESLSRAGVPFDGPIRVHASAEQGWRLRASLHFACGPDGLRLGFREQGTHRVADHRACLQLSGALNAAACDLRAALARRPGTHRQLRAVDLLEAPDGSALVASVASVLAPREASSLAGTLAQVPALTGIGVACHPRRLQWLHGDPHVVASVLGLELRAHVLSFLQSNRFLLEGLAREVRDLVPREGGRILDLYAGVGLFALPLSQREGAEVIAVEHAASASEDARANARSNGLRVRVVESDVARALVSLPHEGAERVVLDPPRSGAGPELVDLLAQRRPRCVVYVSCDPPTLGRDLARFAAHGYRPDVVQMFDLFPNTFHLETVVRLTPGWPASAL